MLGRRWNDAQRGDPKQFVTAIGERDVRNAEEATGLGKGGRPAHYLPRFATEQVVTVNTAAAGGNAELLMGME
jgi:hypothetical protein